MPRINQLPAASSVAQTDVLAIDTPDKTYKVPRSVLAPAPYIATIPTGQWSGSGSDRYITVTASNVTADAMLYPFYDNASAALLNGPVWVIPAAGSFTIHTSAIPSGTVTISVLLAGIVGEAQYQVLADVYSKSQVDSIVSQSTANFDKVIASNIQTNNGYIKYDSGLMIQYGLSTVNATLSQIGTSGIYTQTVTIDLPQSFYTNIYVINASSRFGSGHMVPSGFTPAQANRIQGSIYDFYARSGDIDVRWMAIGRWK